MVIRSTQMQQIATISDARFFNRVRQHVLDSHPDSCSRHDESTLDLLTWKAIQIARYYGLFDFTSAAWFASAMIEINPAFYTQSSIDHWLRNVAIPPEDRVRIMLVKTTSIDWAEARVIS
ncbi:MAG TPA: hypothetical protein VKU01_26055 [Bryobacteraceae bacterium]|nr:hypothetical protein [Bryobacteraceae bacterium]